MDKKELGLINIGQIDEGKRARIDLGDIDALSDDIRRHGLIHPIAILSKESVTDFSLIEDQLDPSKPYLLLGGGRRFNSVKSLIEKGDHAPEIMCRIYHRDMSVDEVKIIELHENLFRKSLDYREEVNLKAEIHELQIKMKGEKIARSANAPGHSISDTAEMLGETRANTSRDIKLAQAIKEDPSIAEAKTKSEAMKLMKKREEEEILSELARRKAEEDSKKQSGKKAAKRRLRDRYQVRDFFDGVKEIPDKSVHLVEIDPPYAIDLKSIKREGKVVTKDYNEIDKRKYAKFMKDTLSESYRILRDGGWLLMWFAPEPWFDDMYKWIKEAGFELRRIPAIWYKQTPGQTMQPAYNLANSYEMMFYARKGSSTIMHKGRSNVFSYKPVPPQYKIHPTERPVQMIAAMLKTFTHEGSRIVVPFAGSGNTLLAAEVAGMDSIGFDLSQQYKDGYDVRVEQGKLLSQYIAEYDSTDRGLTDESGVPLDDSGASVPMSAKERNAANAMAKLRAKYG